jgi:hypothetical protein
MGTTTFGSSSTMRISFSMKVYISVPIGDG